MTSQVNRVISLPADYSKYGWMSFMKTDISNAEIFQKARFEKRMGL